MARFRERVTRREAAPLRAMLVRWAADTAEEVAKAEPRMPDAISDRAADGWDPLVGIADTLGEPWGTAARAAAIALSGAEQEPVDIGERLLADIRDILHPTDPDTGKALPKVERMHLVDLVAALKTIEDAPWADWGRGRA